MPIITHKRGKFYVFNEEGPWSKSIILCLESRLENHPKRFKGVCVRKGNGAYVGQISEHWNSWSYDEVDISVTFIACGGRTNTKMGYSQEETGFHEAAASKFFSFMDFTERYKGQNVITTSNSGNGWLMMKQRNEEDFKKDVSDMSRYYQSTIMEEKEFTKWNDISRFFDGESTLHIPELFYSKIRIGKPEELERGDIWVEPNDQLRHIYLFTGHLYYKFNCEDTISCMPFNNGEISISDIERNLMLCPMTQELKQAEEKAKEYNEAYNGKLTQSMVDDLAWQEITGMTKERALLTLKVFSNEIYPHTRTSDNAKLVEKIITNMTPKNGRSSCVQYCEYLGIDPYGFKI